MGRRRELDVMLPGIKGLDVLRRIREASPVPAVMLTARERESGGVGLEAVEPVLWGACWGRDRFAAFQDLLVLERWG